MFIFDAHLDLSMNALEWNRDLTRSIEDIRQRESHLTDKPDRGRATVCLPEMRKGRIGICVATQIARYVKPKNKLQGWNSPEQAWAQTQGQLAWYRAMEDRGEMVQIRDLAGLKRQVNLWAHNEQTILDAIPPLPPGDPRTAGPPGGGQMQADSQESAPKPIGYILSLEGADSMYSLGCVEKAYAAGLRAIGPAHYGPGTYAQGTDAIGGIGVRGRELLKEMDRLGIILDATHLCDDSFWEAMDHFHGPVWASHNNCRALVPQNRQFSDEQIKHLIGRGAVIGGVLDAWMMVPGWIRRQTTPESAGVKLETLLDHMDHICQLAGNADHVGIGSDLDGGFGREQTAADLETIADLTRYEALLSKRSYTKADTDKIMHGNFLSFLEKAWGKKL